MPLWCQNNVKDFLLEKVELITREIIHGANLE